MKSRLAMLAAAALLSAAAAEIGLRLLGLPQGWEPHLKDFENDWSRRIHHPSSDPTILYELSPNINGMVLDYHVRTNHLGMRGPEVSDTKPAGIQRVVVLGDSITFGWQVDENQTYAAQLAEMLSGAGRAVEVLNMGVSGYNTRQEVSLFINRGTRLSPDLVVLGYCLNDPDDDFLQPLTAYFRNPDWWQWSNLARLLYKAWWKIEVLWYGGGDYEVYLHRKPAFWLSVTNSLTRLAMWSESHRVPVVVVIFPNLSKKLDNSYPYRGLHAQIRDAAEKNGFNVIDLTETYRSRPFELLRVSATDNHPSALGHRLAAEAIFKFITEHYPEWSVKLNSETPSAPDR